MTNVKKTEIEAGQRAYVQTSGNGLKNQLSDRMTKRLEGRFVAVEMIKSRKSVAWLAVPSACFLVS